MAITTLPDHVLNDIFRHLGLEDLAQVGAADRKCRRVARNYLFWKGFLDREFPGTITDNPRQAYVDKKLALKSFKAGVIQKKNSFKAYSEKTEHIQVVGDCLYTCSKYGNFKIWDAKSFEEKLSFQVYCKKVTGFQVVGNTLYIKSYQDYITDDCLIRAYDLETGDHIQELPSFCTCFFVEEKTCFLGMCNGEVEVWDIERATRVRSFKAGDCSIGHLRTFRDRIFTVSHNAVKMWSFEGECLQTFELFLEHGWVKSFQVARDRLITALKRGYIKIWNLNGACLKSLKVSGDFIDVINLFGDNLFIRTGSGVVMLNLKTDKRHYLTPVFSNNFRSCFVDNGRLIYGYCDGTVTVHDFRPQNSLSLSTLVRKIFFEIFPLPTECLPRFF